MLLVNTVTEKKRTVNVCVLRKSYYLNSKCSHMVAVIIRSYNTLAGFCLIPPKSNIFKQMVYYGNQIKCG